MFGMLERNKKQAGNMQEIGVNGNVSELASFDETLRSSNHHIFIGVNRNESELTSFDATLRSSNHHISIGVNGNESELTSLTRPLRVAITIFAAFRKTDWVQVEIRYYEETWSE